MDGRGLGAGPRRGRAAPSTARRRGRVSAQRRSRGGRRRGQGGPCFPPEPPQAMLGCLSRPSHPARPSFAFLFGLGHILPRAALGVSNTSRKCCSGKKKKKAPHGDTTCSRKTFPLFFSWHGLRQLPERIGANSKKPLCPSPSRHQSRDNSSCERRASLKGPPGIPGGVPSALTTSLPALALRNASPRSVRRPASHPLA